MDRGVVHRTCVMLLFLTLLVLVSARTINTSSAISASATVTTGLEKGLVISANVILKGLPCPSFSELKAANFTLVGTIVYSWFGDWEWKKIGEWINAARSGGFSVFVNFWAEPKTAMTWIKRLVSMGVDVIVWDEPISRYNVAQSQLLSVIKAGLKAKASLLFVINEYQSANISTLYKWTAPYPSVRIATDSYSDKTVIDLGINLALKYGKTPLSWLIFCVDEMEFPCYKALSEWISYVKARNLGALFWLVDSAGTWQAQWQQVAGF